MKMKHAMLNNLDLNRRAGGLLMMAVFTFFWACCAYYGLSDTSYKWLLIIFPILCVIFIYYACHLTWKARNLPDQPLADPAEEKKRGKRFGIILAGEGIGIFVAVNIVINLHHRELMLPAIALVVGLHFIPLAKLFKRKFDYYLGTLSILIAVLAITFSLNKMLSESAVLAFTGIGIAVSTTFYGLNMIFSARKVLG